MAAAPDPPSSSSLFCIPQDTAASSVRADVPNNQEAVMQTPHPHLRTSLHLPNPPEIHRCAVFVCSRSDPIRRVSNTERRLALALGSFVNALCFPLPFAAAVLARKDADGGWLLFFTKLQVVRRKDRGFIPHLFTCSVHSSSTEVDNYNGIPVLTVKIKCLWFCVPFFNPP